MTFYITPDRLEEFLGQISEQNKRKELVEIAVAELKEFTEEARSDYLKKKATVAAQLKIEVEDIPRDWKWEPFDCE